MTIFLPTVAQAQFMGRPDREVFLIGSEGSGKTVGLGLAAAQYHQKAGYHALIIGPSYPFMAQPIFGLAARFEDTYKALDGHFNRSHLEYTFESGATISFGYADLNEDPSGPSHWFHRYAASEFGFIGFEGLHRLPQDAYLFLKSRLRVPPGAGFPLRIRATFSPLNFQNSWVKDYAAENNIPVERSDTLPPNPYLSDELRQLLAAGPKPAAPLFTNNETIGE
jgi:hypothetical protein